MRVRRLRLSKPRRRRNRAGQMQAAKQRARREKQERLESALKEYAKLEAAKSRVKRVSTTDPDARVMKQAEGGSAPSYNVQV